jgi:hypothetical protein
VNSRVSLNGPHGLNLSHALSMTLRWPVQWIFCLSAFSITACPAPADVADSPVPSSEDAPSAAGAELLTAFFGLDDALPMLAAGICREAPGRDGMPLVFRRAIDATSLDAADFEVETRSGARARPLCVTLAPANEMDELRTVLLIGDLASAADPPVAVTVVDSLIANDGTELRGASAERIVALEEGPSLVLAERAPEPDPELGTTGRGGGCPLGTPQVITVTWEGGVTVPGGGDVGEAQRDAYTLTLEAGTSRSPTSFADGMDNDNVQDLCVDTATRVTRVMVRAGTVVDPRGDLNPATSLAVP